MQVNKRGDGELSRDQGNQITPPVFGWNSTRFAARNASRSLVAYRTKRPMWEYDGPLPSVRHFLIAATEQFRRSAACLSVKRFSLFTTGSPVRGALYLHLTRIRSNRKQSHTRCLDLCGTTEGLGVLWLEPAEWPNLAAAKKRCRVRLTYLTRDQSTLGW